MKFLIVAVGHRMPRWISAGVEEYARRMPRETRVALLEVKSEARRPNASAAAVRRVLEVERKRIGALLPAGCCKVVLDERGRSLSTRQLAERIAHWRGGGRDVAFIIGGADGTAAALRAEAELVWSLSALTLPHGLVRVILAEQLYRATSILGGHPYHRE